MNSGVYARMSNAEYHGGAGISKSGLDLVRRSPLHYRAAKDAGHREPTLDMRIGTIAHDLILEGATFWDRYALPFSAQIRGALATTEDVKLRLKALGEKTSGVKSELVARLRAADSSAIFLDDLHAEYAEKNSEKDILTLDELVRAKSMRDAVMSHPVAGKLLNPFDGEAELSCYWRDEKTGTLCRCRPDFWRNDGIIVDLKTTRDASPGGFPKSISGFRYHVQEAFYRDGIAAAIKHGGADRAAPHAFLFVAVEKVAPFAVAVYALDSASVEIGRREYREDLDAFAAAKASGIWPGYGEKIQQTGLPEWRLRQEEFGEAV